MLLIDMNNMIPSKVIEKRSRREAPPNKQDFLSDGNFHWNYHRRKDGPRKI